MPASTPPAKPFRVALITFSAPWAENPRTGLYNLLQVQALNRIGSPAEIFVCALRFPRVLESLRPSIRRMNERPLDWVYEGVSCHAAASIFPHPIWVRWNLARTAPRAAEMLVSAAFRRGIQRRLEAFRPDGVYVHDGVMLGHLADVIASRMGIPFAIIEHDPIVWTLGSPEGRRYAQVGSRARAVFGVGLPSVWALRNNLGVSNARFCPNGIARATDEQARSPRPPRYRDRKLVVATGSAIPTKGHAELVRAFADADVPGSLLVIIGDQLLPEVLGLIESLGLGDRVERLPGMPQPELQQYMAWADVFALPSRLESFGMVFAEAMAAGTPVILTRACGIAPHLTHGVHGWVLPVGDHAALVRALRQALTLNPGDRARMGQAGKQLISGVFTWETSARAIIAGLRGDPPPAGLDLDLSDADAMRTALPKFTGQ